LGQHRVGVVWGVGCCLAVGQTGGNTWLFSMSGIPLTFATGIIVPFIEGGRHAGTIRA
jgi:hypothetical protein